ncbi:MAG: tripartite tricarboxylate transporter substrate binding protein [Proteobacteria bacterium]|nr:tripartite tricarboxylate transporter substrate binding protein [Pseudomonadota bacterium]
MKENIPAGVLALLLAAFAALPFAAMAQATSTSPGQAWPSKPIRLVTPFAPGGGTDFVARLVAQKLSERLGQQVVVDNKPGAGSTMGTELALKSPPDGYTLLLTPASYTVNANIYKLNFDPLNDITPIVQISSGPYLVAVHPSLPVKTLKELVAYAQANPDKLSYGSAGNGSSTHLASAFFLDVAKIQMLHVPYKGTGPALNDTIAGNVQVIFGSVAATLQFVKSGRLRALAVTTPQRITAEPDVPTVAESGYPSYEVTNWSGLSGPKGLPRYIVLRLNREVNEIIKGADVAKVLAADGLSPAGGTSERFAGIISTEIPRWGRVIKSSGMKID